MMIHPSAYQVKITFGKFAGQSLGELAEHRRWYLEFLSGADKIADKWRIAAARTLLGEPVEAIAEKIRKPIEQVSQTTILPSEKKDYFLVKFPFDEALTERLKETVDGVQWNEDEGGWRFPAAQIVWLVKFFGGPSQCIVHETVREAYFAEKKRTQDLKLIAAKTDSDFNAPTKLPLRGYQKVALEFAERAGGRILLADPVGLGKTPSAIAGALHNGGKTLIICELNLKTQWEQQIRKFVGPKAKICKWNADGPQGDEKKADWHIVHYNVVDRFVKDFNKLKIMTLICDEVSDWITNYKAIRTKAIMGNWQERRTYPGLNMPKVWLLTATPMKSRVRELLTLFSFLDKKRFNNPAHFVQRYEMGGWGSRNEFQNLDELNERIQELMLRRPKSIRPGQKKPERMEILIDMTPEETAEYEQLMHDLLYKWSLVNPSATHMAPIRNFLFKIKWERLTKVLDQMLESERPCLVFAIQQEHVERIAKKYEEKARYVHGGVTGEDRREQIKQDLIKGNAKIGAYTIQTGSRGMDGLQYVISDTIFVDRSWVPSDHEQAEGRTARDGQPNVPQMYYLTVVNTWEEQLRKLLDEKQEIFDQVIDGKTTLDLKNQQKLKKSVFKDFVALLSQQYDRPTLEVVEE